MARPPARLNDRFRRSAEAHLEIGCFRCCPIPDIGRPNPGYLGAVGNGRSGQVAEVISLRFGIGETCMREAVEVDSEKHLNRDVALPSHAIGRISDGMAMARIRET
jgi:hypothetical protein